VTKYEILLLLDPDVDEARQTEIVGRVRELVEKGDGSWDLHDAWGRRRLAYEIGHKTDGSYHLLHFTSDAPTLDEISRVLRIDDGVMRHMATRRIPGSPARPVAVAAPARQDTEVQEQADDAQADEAVADAEVAEAEVQDAEVVSEEVQDEEAEVETSAEVEEEEE
jgi:small subunit ribosomal protein S6